jgi:hypothetical protein
MNYVCFNYCVFQIPFPSASNLHLSLICFTFSYNYHPLTFHRHIPFSWHYYKTWKCATYCYSEPMLEATKIKLIQPYIQIQLIINIFILNQTHDVSNEKQELQSHTIPPVSLLCSLFLWYENMSSIIC